MTLVLLPRERAVIDKHQRAPRAVKPGSDWYFVLVKQRPPLATRTGTRLETICELSAPSLADARTSAADIIAELRAEHEGRCDDEIRHDDVWAAAAASALSAPSRGITVGPLVNGTVIEIAPRKKVLNRQWGMRGTTCPACGGPKARQAVRCRACSADALRRPTLRCPSCERPMSHDAAQCHTCQADERHERAGRRADRVLEMWRLRADEGLTNKQIAERLDTTTAMVAVELSQMRVLGYDVPGSPGMGSGGTAGAASVLRSHTRSLGAALLARGIVPPGPGPGT